MVRPSSRSVPCIIAAIATGCSPEGQYEARRVMARPWLRDVPSARSPLPAVALLLLAAGKRVVLETLDPAMLGGQLHVGVVDVAAGRLW
jgi:hypothetical protein